MQEIKDFFLSFENNQRKMTHYKKRQNYSNYCGFLIRKHWSRLIIGHRPVHSDWSSNATGRKLRQSETRSSGTTGEDSLLLNLVKGVSPKQPATLSHIMGRNLRKSEEEQAMLQARGQVPKQPRCPDAVSCRPTHQSSKPLSNLNWPSTARY